MRYILLSPRALLSLAGSHNGAIAEEKEEELSACTLGENEGPPADALEENEQLPTCTLQEVVVEGERVETHQIPVAHGTTQ